MVRSLLSTVFLVLPASYLFAGTLADEESFAPTAPVENPASNLVSRTPANCDDPEVPYHYETPNNGTVRLTAQNQTGVSISGDVIREGPLSGEIIKEFTVPAGGNFVFVDDDVLSGTTYLYVFEYRREDNPNYVINLDSITPVATQPALGSFNIIATSYDGAYDVIRDGYVVQIDNTNVQAEANADYTRSVVFYLNGKKYIDNVAPFSLFGDICGDYLPGRFENGDYSLVAIAYPKIFGQGISGDTARVDFSVNILYPDGLSVMPNPVTENTVVQLSGLPDEPVVAYLNSFTWPYRRLLYQGTLDSNGQLEFPLPSENLQQGIYIVTAKVGQKFFWKRILVE